jgi:tetratricopeptide (TPR) repeat protein
VAACERLAVAALIQATYLHGRMGNQERAHEAARLAAPLIAHLGDEQMAASLAYYEGNTYVHEEKLAEADAPLQKALALRRKLYTAPSGLIAEALNSLGELRRRQGRVDEATAMHRESVAMMEAAVGPMHLQVAFGLNNLATDLSYAGVRLEEAEAIYRRVIDLRTAALGPEHPDTAVALSNLALLLQRMGRPAEARGLVERALAIKRKALGPAHPSVAYTLMVLADIDAKSGRPDEAIARATEALEIRKKAHLQGELVAECLSVIGEAAQARNDHAGAAGYFQQAIAILEKSAAAELSLVAPLTALGMSLREQGAVARSIAPLERALAIGEKKRLDPLQMATTRFALARSLWLAGRDRRRAVALAEQARGDDRAGGAGAREHGAEVERWLHAENQRR